MINVTKTFLPPFEEYSSVLRRAWDKHWVTNSGELVMELEGKLKSYLNVDNLLYTSNGTIPLQMALKALEITKEVITTPFSYVATTNVILWESCQPVFVDIDPLSLCIDASKIEAAITPRTEAILATHVYGIPCDVEKIELIAAKHNLKVIYDGAHSFGCQYKGKSLLSYGDISTCSFHATKVFHTGEGGCIIANDNKLHHQLELYRQFGHTGDHYDSIGINAKNSEFHAALGICNLNYIDEILTTREDKWKKYYHALSQNQGLQFLSIGKNLQYNYSYFPIVFANESALEKCINALNEVSIFPRRYFFPSLNKLNYLSYQPCPVSEGIAKRVLCLPLYHDLKNTDQDIIIEICSNSLKKK